MDTQVLLQIKVSTLTFLLSKTEGDQKMKFLTTLCYVLVIAMLAAACADYALDNMQENQNTRQATIESLGL